MLDKVRIKNASGCFFAPRRAATAQLDVLPDQGFIGADGWKR
jgi:hypothetical protein